MARSRHAMRVHPLRSKGVVVGVPVAAAVAFGAHSVLGFTPVADQQDGPTTASEAPSAAPVQGYGLATTPPPTTLDLLSAPGDTTSSSDPASAGTSGSGSAAGSASTASRSTTTKIVGPRAAVGPTETVPIAAAAAPAPAPAAAAPSMMTFSGGEQEQARPAAAPAAQAAPEQAPQQQTESDDDGGQRSSGGSLLDLDLGVAKVSVLSFGQ